MKGYRVDSTVVMEMGLIGEWLDGIGAGWLPGVGWGFTGDVECDALQYMFAAARYPCLLGFRMDYAMTFTFGMGGNSLACICTVTMMEDLCRAPGSSDGKNR